MGGVNKNQIDIDKRRCSHCREIKSCDNFHKCKNKSGFQSWCKLCQQNRDRSGELIYYNCKTCNKPCQRRKLSTNAEEKHKKICPTCIRKKMLESTGGHSWNYTGSENFTGSLIASWKCSAKRRGHIWELSKEDLEEKFREQQGVCALSGLKMGGNYGSGRRPSLDRINPKLGYLKNNFQFVCMAINMMRNKLTEEEFIFWCQSVSKHRSSDKDIECITSNFNSKSYKDNEIENGKDSYQEHKEPLNYPKFIGFREDGYVGIEDIDKKNNLVRNSR